MVDHQIKKCLSKNRIFKDEDNYWIIKEYFIPSADCIVKGNPK